MAHPNREAGEPDNVHDGAGLEDVDNVALFVSSQQGDRDAFSELIRRNQSRIHAVTMGILRREDEAEEAIQNACFLAFRKLSQCRDARAFSAWLCRIASNQAISQLREAKRLDRVSFSDDSDAGGLGDIVCWRTTPEDQLGTSEIHDLLRRELQFVPSHLRDVLVLSDVMGLPSAEVAAQLGLEHGVIKSRLFRARRIMRRRLQRHMGRMGAASLTTETNSLMRSLQGRVTEKRSAKQSPP